MIKLAALWIGLALFFVLTLFLTQWITSSEQYTPRLQASSNSRLAVTFAHADHVQQTCIGCHHNYVDDTGSGFCFDCHIQDPQVNELMEEQFHELCRGCHEQQQQAYADHGPTRVCQECHQADLAP